MATNMVVMEHGSIVEKEVKNNHGCCKGGPGYSSPLTAMSSPRESHVYVTCVYTGIGTEKPDYLATVDIDLNSQTYSKVIHRLPMPHIGDELNHSGWNAYSSCYGDASTSWRYLVLPSLIFGCIYAINTQENPKATTLHKYVELTDIIRKTGLAYPHTAHCLASGDIMVSCLGDKDGKAEGNGFLLLDSNFMWDKPGHSPLFGYDFWCQPRHKTMISTSRGAPAAFAKGFNLQDVSDGLYGRHLHVYSCPDGELKQTMYLGNTGLLPLEIRFLHDPSKDTGFVGCALTGNMVRFFKTPEASWSHEIAISVKPLKDPKNPGLIGQVWVGGLIQKGSSVLAEADDGTTYQVDVPEIKGKRLRGGPQMIQLNLDGKRLYVTNSLFGQWDHQFYPDVVKKGSHILQIDVNTEKGGLAINQNFFVDFGSEPDGPSIAHEMRYPGRDCTSDIWI
ncbi:unnamed protein product [Camellia sinensis]